ncbi:MAG: ATP synthase F1 subunit epsilon [Candidatus Moranbacteria bacterium]|nr:ATP synthase F1 subunit epsilon [Candidatus Moranbacteria bacterium]
MTKGFNEINFKIVTPEKIVYEDVISKVTLPTLVGQITILPNHESLVGVIVPGEICITKKNEGDFCFLAVDDGFLEVDDNSVRVFADMASKAEDLDEELILKATEEAKKAMEERKTTSEIKFLEASNRLKRELIKLKVLKKHKNRK